MNKDSLDIDFLEISDKDVVYERIMTIPSLWRDGNISGRNREPVGQKTEVEVIEKKIQWHDEESNRVAKKLKEEKIKLPWQFGDRFGERLKITGLRSGAFGVVVILEYAGTIGNRKFVGKVLKSFLKPNYLNLPETQQEKNAKAFLEEALPWLRMGQHVNIVPVRALKNIWNTRLKQNIPFIFAEYMPQGSLRENMNKRGKLTMRECLSLGIQICSGLINAYKHGITAHKDLKPDNILLHSERVYRLTDFSVGVVGTPGYMAPEQVSLFWKNRGFNFGQSDDVIDHRADQFAVGLVMLEALTGETPFSICRESCHIKERAQEFLCKGVGGIRAGLVPEVMQGILDRILATRAVKRYRSMEDFQRKLLEVYEKEFNRYVQTEVNIDDSAEWWFDRGLAFCEIERFAESELSLMKASERLKIIPNKERDRANCLMALGSVYSKTARPIEAESNTAAALSIFKSIDNSERDQAKCIRNLGIIYNDICRYNQAERCIFQAIEILREIPESGITQIECIYDLGNVYRCSERYIEAARCFTYVLNILKDMPEVIHLQATCNTNLGNIYAEISRYAEAENCYRQALDSFKSIPGSEPSQAICNMNLGNICTKSEQYDKALTFYKNALDIFSKIPGYEKRHAECEVNFGNLLRRTGQFYGAERSLKSALSMYLTIPGTDSFKAACYLNLGNTQAGMCRYNEAKRSFLEALSIYQRIPRSGLHRARCTANLSLLFLNLRDNSSAREYIAKTIEFSDNFPNESNEEIKTFCNKILQRISMNANKKISKYHHWLIKYYKLPSYIKLFFILIFCIFGVIIFITLVGSILSFILDLFPNS